MIASHFECQFAAARRSVACSAARGQQMLIATVRVSIRSSGDVNSAPDGYALLFTGVDGMGILPAPVKQMSYDRTRI